MYIRGFTLLELLVVLSIMTLLLTIGLPGLSQQIKNTRTRTAMLEFVDAVNLTRNTAVTTNKRATLAALGAWQNGWEAFIDENHNGTREAGERLLLRQDIPYDTVTISGNRYVGRYASFIGTGQGARANGRPEGAMLLGTFTICPQSNGNGYELRLSRGGRLKMTFSHHCSTP